jgi:phosphonate transport system permease protein
MGDRGNSPSCVFYPDTNTGAILKGIFSPNSAKMIPMLAALVETIYLALMATVLAFPLLCAFFFCRKNLMYESLLGKIANI